jgi:hypothetical protein
MLDERALQIALLAAALASLIVLVDLFGDAIRVGCLVVIGLVTIVCAPARRVRGGGWWSLLAAGAVAAIAGAALAQAAETVGGLIAAIGGVLVVIAATIGFPLAER